MLIEKQQSTFTVGFHLTGNGVCWGVRKKAARLPKATAKSQGKWEEVSLHSNLTCYWTIISHMSFPKKSPATQTTRDSVG